MKVFHTSAVFFHIFNCVFLLLPNASPVYYNLKEDVSLLQCITPQI